MSAAPRNAAAARQPEHRAARDLAARGLAALRRLLPRVARVRRA